MVRTREEWQRLRERGRNRYVLTRGILVRGIPMAVAVILVLEVVQGRPIGGELLRDPGFHQRLLVAVLVFSIGGILSAFARWKSLEARFEDRDG